MGNKNTESNEFSQVVRQLKEQRNKSSVLNVDAKPDQRYRALMLGAIKNSKLHELYKINLENYVKSRLTKDQISSVLMVLSLVKSNEIPTQILKTKDSSISSKKQTTKNVQVKFKAINHRRRSKIITDNDNVIEYHLQDTVQGRMKTASDFIRYQMVKQSHPFSRLCGEYTKLLKYDENINKPCHSDSQYEKWEIVYHNTTKEFCMVLIKGCLEIYKKWFLRYAGIDEKKYNKLIFPLVLNQIWAVNKQNLFKNTKILLDKNKLPLKISMDQISNDSKLGFMTPDFFNIDKELQIQGHYFGSIFELSELSYYYRPSDILIQLQSIKNSICTDIDNYHSLTQKNEVYQINGDNIMGIIAYLISKVAVKINQIYLQLLFLRIVYGEPIYYSMDISSYMFSTLVGALQFLQNEQFKETLIKQRQKKSLVSDQNSNIMKQNKETHCCGSLVGNSG